MAHLTTSLLILSFGLFGILDQRTVRIFEPHEYRYTGGSYDNELIKYRLFTPKPMDPNRKYPLIVWLHGAGESGKDNEGQLSHTQYHIRNPDNLSFSPFFILATQCPSKTTGWTSTTTPANLSSTGKDDAPITITMEILDSLIEKYPIDENRISLLGVSSGGGAAWSIPNRYPNRFSAIVPIASSGTSDHSHIQSLVDVPVWAFSCTYDPSISIEQARTTVDAINRTGGVAHLTEVPSKSHNSWKVALREYKIINWMMRQKRGEPCHPKPGGKPWKTSEIAIQGGLVAFIALIGFAVWRQKRTKQTGPPDKTKTEPTDHDSDASPDKEDNNIS
jgi:predicted peptidase